MYIDLSELTDGFSSKLKVISFFLAVIKINKLKKILYIYEKKNKESPYLFTDHCLIKNFKLVKLKKKPSTNIIFNPYNYFSELKKLKSENFIDKKKEKKFNLIAELSYTNFKPNKKIQKQINSINLPKNFVGIHIRSTDRAITLNNFINKIHFKEMIFDFQIKNMIKDINIFLRSKNIFNSIFICSDDKSYKENFIVELKKANIVYFNKSKFNTKKFRETSGKDFVTELFCLSKSKIIVSTVGGAVPNSAFLISKKRIEIYKWINIFNLFYFFRIIILVIFFSKRSKNFLSNIFFK
jgi:hypothetical protein